MSLIGVITFCTFWLSSWNEFLAVCCGISAFSSSFFVLTRVSEQIVGRGPDLSNQPRWRLAMRVVGAGILKFLLPALLIWWGLQQEASVLWLVGGCLLGLSAATASLWMHGYEKFK